MNKSSDVIVDGKFYIVSDNEAFISVRKTIKGQRYKRISIQLINEQSNESDTSCPGWFPLKRKEKGRFYLIVTKNGIYNVVYQNRQEP